MQGRTDESMWQRGGRPGRQWGNASQGWDEDRYDDLRETDYRTWGPEGRPEYGYDRGIDQGFGFYGRPGVGSQGFDQGRGGMRQGQTSASQFGPHAGKGPRNYRRSDDRIREEVCDRLCDDSWMDASELEVQVENGEVTLSGDVDSRQQKRLAEDIAEQVPGVVDVHNRLRVHDHSMMAATSAGTSQGQKQHDQNGATVRSR